MSFSMPQTRPEEPASGTQVTLRLMALSDLHGHLWPYDYPSDRPDPSLGLTRAAALIRKAREETANCLLFDNGDFLQGTSLSDRLGEEGLPEGQRHPVVAAYNALALSAGTIGNHEFNFGLPFLRRTLEDARYPLVLANLTPINGEEPLCPSHVILDAFLSDAEGNMHRVRVGVTGVTPPQCLVWDHDHLAGLFKAEDPAVAVERLVPQMREAGAELVVVLSHGGLGDPEPAKGSENASLAISAIPGVDAVIAGHVHQAIPDAGETDHWSKDDLWHAPILMPAPFAKTLGVLDLELLYEGGRWSSRSARIENRRSLDALPDLGAVPKRATRAPDDVPGDPLISAVCRPLHQSTLTHLMRPVGKTAAPLFSHLAAIGVDPATRCIAQAQRWYLEKALDGSPEAKLPLLSAAAPFKLGGRAGEGSYAKVEPGMVTLRTLNDLYPYPNRLVAVSITGAELRDWLERSAGFFAQVMPGSKDAPLRDLGFPAHDFDCLDGVTWQIDLSVPPLFSANGTRLRDAPGRIRGLRHEGMAIKETDQFVVATNSYRAAGGGHFPALGPDRIIFDSELSVSQVLAQFFAEHDRFVPDSAPQWRFWPLEGTSVLVNTGRGARAYLESYLLREIEPQRETPEGALPLRVWLDNG